MYYSIYNKWHCCGRFFPFHSTETTLNSGSYLQAKFQQDCSISTVLLLPFFPLSLSSSLPPSHLPSLSLSISPGGGRNVSGPLPSHAPVFPRGLTRRWMGIPSSSASFFPSPIPPENCDSSPGDHALSQMAVISSPLAVMLRHRAHWMTIGVGHLQSHFLMSHTWHSGHRHTLPKAVYLFIERSIFKRDLG